jgi:O-6-methylguanine DNA methyltransferase
MKSRRKISSAISGNKSLSGFEKRVYGAVLTIPAGQVRSYAWVAGRTGSPKAARAVGNALNKNPYAPAVPCHRVIRSDGSIGGQEAHAEARRH